jgi:recombination protein RecA
MFSAKKRRNCMNPAATLTTTLGLRPKLRPFETLPTGVREIEALIGGVPRGAISEIIGPESSGRTALAHALLAAATAKLEICAYVDTNESFDPRSAAASGVVLDQLVWVRCGSNVEHAMKAVDNLLHAGGFGVVVLDLCQTPQRACRRIPLSYWYRFRRAVENTPAVLALVEREPLAKSCAALMIEVRRKKALWSGAPEFRILRGMDIEAASRKPVRPATAVVNARMVG